jgi:23S rRNA (uridine2552-2'-O)-methyltransferase
MSHSKSSKRWLKEHFNDKYVKQAKHEGLRARSAYKLIEINQRHKIITPGMIVVDLGAAPGSWTAYASKIVGAKGKIIALDILPIVPIMYKDASKNNAVVAAANITYIQGDFTQQTVLDQLEQNIAPRSVDVVLSDMAPNTTGIREVDQARSLELVYTAARFTQQNLRTNGTFLFKVFQSQDVVALTKELRAWFREVKIIKPEASRSRSQEVFVLALGKI